MNILTSEQLKAADARTLTLQHITSWQLMERAATALFDRLKTDVDIYTNRFVLLCGPGNNGGDGLALARMIHASGGEVDVYLLEASAYSPDNLRNQEMLSNLPVNFFNLHSLPDLPPEAILIDALYGYGLNRVLGPEWAPMMKQINEPGRRIFAVDMPSGLLADAHTPPDAPVVIPEKVYTFHSVKKALLLPENAVEDFCILPIGLVEDTFLSSETYLTPAEVRTWIRKPARFSHKGSFGHALLAGGSYGKIGAVILGARAALKTGCGMVSCFVPSCGYLPLQTAVPEAMVMTSEEHHFLDSFPGSPNAFSAIGIGTGMGTAGPTARAFFRFLSSRPLPPLVLDADALNILSMHPEELRHLPEKTILTPHPKELERLLGSWMTDFEKLERARQFCIQHQVILVIKGANSAVLFPDGSVSYNSTGNPGMAKGGSGDVLTGIITALLAQGYSPETATALGVFVHGLAGDLACRHLGPRGMTAVDILHNLPAAWRELS